MEFHKLRKSRPKANGNKMAQTITEIPDSIRAAVPGGKDIFFTPEDFTSEQAYLRLAKGSPYLTQADFVDINQYRRYFILSCGLLEGVVIVGGRERSGKSLFMYHLAYQIRELFGKPCVLNRKPRPGFGECYIIPDDEFKTELDKYNEIVKEVEALQLGDDSEFPPDIQQRLRELKFYSKVYVLDEAYRETAKDRRTNRARAYGELVRQWGHLHTLFIFASPNPRDIDVRLIYERKTHQVSCVYDEGKCHYKIFVNTPFIQGMVKAMELVPEEWGHIWYSHNLIGAGAFKIR